MYVELEANLVLTSRPVDCHPLSTGSFHALALSHAFVLDYKITPGCNELPTMGDTNSFLPSQLFFHIHDL